MIFCSIAVHYVIIETTRKYLKRKICQQRLRNVTRAMLFISINNMHLYLTININLIHFYTESKCIFIHVIKMFLIKEIIFRAAIVVHSNKTLYELTWCL